MKFWKRWNYMLLFIVSGVIYMTVVDGWNTYTDGALESKEWVRVLLEDRNGSGTEGKWEIVEGQNVTGHNTTGQNQTGQTGTGQEDDKKNGLVAPVDAPFYEGDDKKNTTEEIKAGEEPEEPRGPIYMTVGDEYFADAVFIGDSRTVAMQKYGDLQDISTFYASTGLSVYKLFDNKYIPNPAGTGKITLEEALSERSFGKIYLMLGINEMGTGTVETFTEKYREVVTRLQELQPNAIIYVQGIMRVTTKRSNQGDYIHNQGINERNEQLETLADNVNIFYLDVNPLISDEDGGLIESYTFDGVHLKAKYVEIWKDYLKTHAISLD